VREFEATFLGVLESKHKETLELLRQGQLTDAVIATLESVGKELAKSYAN
jgi:F-type H+-transporting ATPase subunit alpha